MNNLDIIQKIMKENDLKVEIFRSTGLEDSIEAGKVDLFREIIYLNLSCVEDFELIVSVFCHEWAHIQNKHNNKYPAYHRIFDKSTITEKDFRSFKATFLRAERYTDKIAAKICEENFPSVRYQGTYHLPHWDEFFKLQFETFTYEDFLHMINEIKDKGLF